jgi:8-oxo-dGTP pyrophosphatase MutT (NUDIX family)
MAPENPHPKKNNPVTMSEEVMLETAAGGVLFRNGNASKAEGAPEVLLIYRRELWDLPKGKQEPNESIKMCARREVSEEVGCSLPRIEGRLGTTQHSFYRDDQKYDKTTYWFAMNIPSEEHAELEPQAEEQIEDLEWVSLDTAKEKVGFENLRVLLNRFEQWYQDWKGS